MVLYDLNVLNTWILAAVDFCERAFPFWSFIAWVQSYFLPRGRRFAGHFHVVYQNVSLVTALLVGILGLFNWVTHLCLYIFECSKARWLSTVGRGRGAVQ